MAALKPREFTPIWDYTFHFGKHRGKTFVNVWNTDHSYAVWACENTTQIRVPLDSKNLVIEKWIEFALQKRQWGSAAPSDPVPAPPSVTAADVEEIVGAIDPSLVPRDPLNNFDWISF